MQMQQQQAWRLQQGQRGSYCSAALEAAHHAPDISSILHTKHKQNLVITSFTAAYSLNYDGM